MVRIITDSAADFEPWELEQKGITCIPLTVMFGEVEYQENTNLSKQQFYELLAASEELPKTAQASPGILLGIFREVIAQSEEAIYICLSSALSGTYQNAVMIKQMVDSNACYVVDSLNGTGGQRMLIEHAVKLRDMGRSAAEIVTEIEALRDRIVLYACMDTLENLYRGGRISQTAYKLGTFAQIKPIIHVNRQGQVTVPVKAMGMRKAMAQLCTLATKTARDENFPLYVMYTSDRNAAERLASCLREKGYEIPDERLIRVGAAIGTHIGLNAVGYVYVGAE